MELQTTTPSTLPFLPLNQGPSPDDLSELDDLLAESEAAAKASKRRHHLIKVAVAGIEDRVMTWEVLDYAQIWSTTICGNCGHETPKLFVRNMRKSRLVGGQAKLVNWATVEEIPAGHPEPTKMALVVRPVKRCECCTPEISNIQWTTFEEVVR